MSSLTAIMYLLVIYQLKHFICDYPLREEYMWRKFDINPRLWISALGMHAGLHALFTGVIASWFYYFSFFQHTNNWVWKYLTLLMMFDFCVHFVMDLVLTSPNLLGRFKPLAEDAYRQIKIIAGMNNGTSPFAKRRLNHNAYFWWSLKFVQMVHHLSNLFIIWCLVTH